MSIWKCKYCGQISDFDKVSNADGYCHRHPVGVGTHSFVMSQEQITEEESLDDYIIRQIDKNLAYERRRVGEAIDRVKAKIDDNSGMNDTFDLGGKWALDALRAELANGPAPNPVMEDVK